MDIGNVAIRLISALPEEIISAAGNAGIQMSNIQYKDLLHVHLVIPAAQLSKFKEIVERFGGETVVLENKGFYAYLKRCAARPVLLIGVCIWLLLILYLPTRVLFVEVTGNDDVPTHIILDAAEKHGLHFGSSRRELRSEKIKNVLLDEIPGLQWIGVNTYGCVAVISVKERIVQVDHADETGVCSIVAAHDGVIHEIISTKGTVRCAVGQAVRKGQILISGYTDCGISIRAERASGEIYAITNRNLRAKYPTQYEKMEDIIEERTAYQIQIGKKLINLCKDSGIPGVRCVKMYNKKQLTLPGGLSLPFSLVVQKTVYYKTASMRVNIEEYSLDIKNLMDSAVLNDMLAGRILQSNLSASKLNDCVSLLGTYSCMEMIGKIHQEEFVR